jgi:membrane protein
VRESNIRTMAERMTESRLSTAEQVASLWTLGGLSVSELSARVWRAFSDNFLLDRAAALAFNFILALFPLLLFLLAVLGIFASRGTALRDNLMQYLSQVLPPAAFQVVSHTLAEVARTSGGGKLTLGIVLTLWFASGGMASMISALDGAYEVRENRSWFKVRATAVVLTVAISILVISALLVILAGSYVVNVLATHYGLGEAAVIAWRIAEIIVALLFVSVSFSLIYYNGPDLEEQHWYWITPGSVIGVLLWVAASFGFRAYLHFFNSYSRTYGSLGAAMILLMWLYITGLAFLVGGEINAQIEHAVAVRGHPEAKAPGEKKAA